MDFSKELLKTLATPRPHLMQIFTTPGSIGCECSCGWSFESAGRDESSKSAVRAMFAVHRDEDLIVGRD